VMEVIQVQNIILPTKAASRSFVWLADFITYVTCITCITSITARRNRWRA